MLFILLLQVQPHMWHHYSQCSQPRGRAWNATIFVSHSGCSGKKRRYSWLNPIVWPAITDNAPCMYMLKLWPSVLSLNVSPSWETSRTQNTRIAQQYCKHWIFTRHLQLTNYTLYSTPLHTSYPQFHTRIDIYASTIHSLQHSNFLEIVHDSLLNGIERKFKDPFLLILKRHA